MGSFVKGASQRPTWHVGFETLEQRRLLSAAILKDIAPGPDSSMPSDFVTADDHVYFSVLYGGQVWKLWQTDGTAEGTKPVADNLAPLYQPYFDNLTPGTKNQLPEGFVLPPGHHGIANPTAIGDTVWAFEIAYEGSHSIRAYLRSFGSNGSTTRDEIGGMSTSLFGNTISKIRNVNGKPVFYFGDTTEPTYSGQSVAKWYTADANGNVIESADQSFSYNEAQDSYLNAEPDGTQFAPGPTSAVLHDTRYVAFDDGTHGIEFGSIDADVVPPPPPNTPTSTNPPPVGSPADPVFVANGVLRISGTSSADTITVGRVYKHANWLEVNLNGTSERFAFSGVKQIRADLGAGNDSFNLTEGHGAVAIAASVVGGAGNDTIVTAAGADTLYGQDGTDFLYGNANRDRLDGGAGDDRLNGGGGIDVLYGAQGNDRFVNMSAHERKDVVDDILA